jgi:hypothetical protein
MASQILRPGRKYWLIQGPWGERRFPDMCPSEFYSLLSVELFGDATHGRTEVALAVMRSSWDDAGKRWVKDGGLQSAG